MTRKCIQVRVEKIYYLTSMNNIKIEELMKVRFDGIANRIGQLSKRESESLLLEHLEWLEEDGRLKKSYF